ncbi:MAG: glycosyltransferase family 2 protein [Sarcina sp.]
MGKKKKISVITPYYKGKETIFNTITSVFAAEKKCIDIDLEYVVIIDSMEDKEEIYSLIKNKYKNKINIIKNEKNIGVAKSRNKALKNTNFDYVLFLDQDDNISEDYFIKMNDGIKRDADLIISNAYVVNIKNDKRVKMYSKNLNINLKTFLEGNQVLSPGQVLFSKNIADIDDLYTGCSIEYKGADDWAAYINVFINHRDLNTYYVQTPIFYYNLHDNNYSRNWQEMNLSAVKTAEYYMDKVNESEKLILQKHIDRLLFENKYKADDYSFGFKDLNMILSYYKYKIFDYNKLFHFINKKITKFYN